MLRNKSLLLTYSVLIIFTLLTFYNVFNSFNLKTVDKYITTYLPNSSGIVVYKPLTANTMKCNLTTINVIISGMINTGFFNIVDDLSNKDTLDITLSNGEEYYRILYNRRTRDYMCLSNPFLKNYLPMTYINE